MADPSILAARMDGVILVVDAGKTRVEELVRSKERLTRGAARVLGAVLNRLSRRIPDYYHDNSQYRSSNGTNRSHGSSTNGQVTAGDASRPGAKVQ